MRLEEQITLYFKEGRSDKVYEVDLCCVGTDQFVVNFRYGRRGSSLREGTKTESPVSQSQARAILAKLVAEKERKGYVLAAGSGDSGSGDSGSGDSGSGDSGSAITTDGAPNQQEQVRNQALLTHLKTGGRGRRPLSRVIWRIGELALTEAEPMLIERLLHANGQDGQRGYGQENQHGVHQYTLLWALARCGGPLAIDAIGAYRQNVDRPVAHVDAMAVEALRSLAIRVDESLRAQLESRQISEMPPKIAEAIRVDDADGLVTLLKDSLEERHERFSQSLLALYRHGGDVTRPAVCEVLQSVPFDYGLFSTVRTIFKMAEGRRDGHVFGVLAHRIETVRANSVVWSGWDRQPGAFSKATRLYLRKRVARTLLRLGEDKSPDFIAMAVGVLLPYTTIPKSSLGANFLLYGQNERVRIPGDGAGGWMSARVHTSTESSGANSGAISDANSGAISGANSGAISDANSGAISDANSGAIWGTRQEAFPHLWEARPAALLHLIDDSKCEAVHQMAVAILRDCSEFCAGLDLPVLEMLVSAQFDISAKLGFELIKPRPLSSALAGVLCGSRLAEARAHAHAWLRLQPVSADDSELWATLIMSEQEDNRSVARSVLSSNYVSEEFGMLVVGRVIADLKGSQDDRDTTMFADMVAILLAVCEVPATTLGEEVLRDLLSHSLLGVQEVGATLLLHNRALSSSVPQDILIGLLDSEYSSIRSVGTQLLAKLPRHELTSHPELLIHLALHQLSDLRVGTKETILSLAGFDATFAGIVANALCEALLRKLPKGAPATAIELLISPKLSKHLPKAEQGHTLRLLRMKSPHARQLGLLFLGQLQADEFTLFDLVSLASHETALVRKNAWEKCENSVDRFRMAMPAVARLLDSSWQDTRLFAIDFLSDKFEKDDVGPAALIAICDSIRPEIQRFGQKLITENFREEDGQEYLAKLSEHPSTRLQVFVTNYIERYAKDDAQILSDLQPYFLSVLSRVNSGGVAKRRCLRFLRDEGLKTPAAAVIVANILTRQSVTIAIGNKATIISAMVELQGAFPDIDLPIRMLQPEPRHAV